MVAEVRANANTLDIQISDADFRKLAENIPTLCWIAGADGYIIWYNRRWYEYTGTTPADMTGWGWQSVHDTRTLPIVLERWQAAISSGQPFEMVFPIRGADGVFRPFLTRINPGFDENGTLTNWFGVNTDISLQVEAEDAVAKYEGKFRVLADAMPQMVWSATPDGDHAYFNSRWYEFTGAPIGSTDGWAWSRMVHSDDQAIVLSSWRHSLETGVPYHAEFRLRHRSGAYRWVLCRAQAERKANGDITGWYGTSTDIEDIVQARLVLKRSRDELEAEVVARTGERNLLATLVETTDVLVTAIDTSANILALNKASADGFQHLYGVRAKVGDNLLTLLEPFPDLLAVSWAAWSRAIAGEEFSLVEARGDVAHSQSHYEMQFRPLRNDTGEIIGAFQFARNVTQRVRDQAMLAQAQEALRESQKLESIGQLTGGVAHDFNNLLTPIIGTLDLLQRRAGGGERERRLIDAASRAAERAKILVQRLLAFARRQPLQSVPVDIAALVEGLSDLLASTLGPQVKLVIEVDADLPPAQADPGQLEMAILNLGLNARDAMEAGGRLLIRATRETIAAGHPSQLAPGNYLRISVVDTGIGMDEATRRRAVEPFFSTKGVGKGTGLGLSMAHGLALQLGGALAIESEPGVGTEVVIWLPPSEEAARASDVSHPSKHATAAAGAVLLVDDEDLIRVSIVDMLTELGFEVREAASADAALQALDAGFAPDILITDHLMPGATGVELAHAVRARRPQTRVLIISGFADVDEIDPSLPRLTKPFVLGDLARHINAVRHDRAAE